MEIRSYTDLLTALRKRHDYFASLGCRLSDHGLDNFYADDYTETDVQQIFKKVMDGKLLDETEIRRFRSALLFELAVMDWEKDGPSNIISVWSETVPPVCFRFWDRIRGLMPSWK